MKYVGLFILFLSSFASGFAQIKVHAHNDYAKKRPFFEAYEVKVAQIEADVFLVGDSLMVAHSRDEIKNTRSLRQLYLAPIDSLFQIYHHKVSADPNYTFSLMIDVKDNWETVYPVLKREIEKYGQTFNRHQNKLAIQIIISGNRPATNTFHQYPKWLFFDGLPSLEYAPKDLKRVTMISDNFTKYSKWKGVGTLSEEDRFKLITLVKHASSLNKPLRLWAAPDVPEVWQLQLNIGARIINTDKVKLVKEYIATHGF
jgi:hypothetical protein